MGGRRPYVFIGSSTEGLPIAEAIQANLEHTCECHIWSQGVFGLGTGPMESLVRHLGRFDFAVLVLTPDDVVTTRGAVQPTARDNVVFELGMFIGKIGLLTLFSTLIAVGLHSISRSPIELSDAIKNSVGHPAYQSLFVLLVMISVRKILFRLNDQEV